MTPHMVIHCANVYGDVCMENNVRMFINLLKYHDQYCQGKLIYFGSGAEFDRPHWKGDMAESYFGEYIPQDQYGLSKYVMNEMSKHYKNVYNLRLFAVTGRYEERSKRFPSYCCQQILKGEPIKLFKNFRFDYLDVDDLCQIVENFITLEPVYQEYNVCTGKLIPLLDIALQISHIANKPVRIEDEDRTESYTQYGGNNKRLLDELPFTFTPTYKTLEKLYEHIRTQQTV